MTFRDAELIIVSICGVEKMNNKQMEDEIYNNLCLELYNKNKKSINNLNWASCTGAISTTGFAVCAFNTPNLFACGASWTLAATAGILTILACTKRYQIFKQIESEARKAAEELVATQEKINTFIGPLASMFGLDISVTGSFIVDGESLFEVPIADTSEEDRVIEADFEVIEEENVDLALSQERAFALRDYINDVAYDGYEEDLATIERLIMEIVSSEDESYVLNINYEVNDLAKKAYDKALGLYGIGR